MEDIENLGPYLKTIREERKIPIAEIAQEFKTKLELVQALESNDFSKFPAPTYVKGFLRRYAKYLGLDPDQIIAIYNKNYKKESEQIFVLERKEIPAMGIKIPKLKAILWTSAGIVIVLLITFGGMRVIRSLKDKDIHKKPLKTIHKKMPSENTIPLPPTQITTPIQLAVQTIDTVWMRVYADEKLIFEGILAKNEEKKWNAGTFFKLRIGNPNNVNLTINGKGIGKLSPYGPVNVLINEKGIKVEK